MKSATLVLLTVSALTAAPGTALPTCRSGRFLVLPEVYVNGAGPFRMMLDTGNASSLIRPSIAKRIGLRPTGWLEQSTAAGERILPAVLLDELRVGNVIDKTVEMMIGDVRLAGVDGVLGQSWLVGHDYLLDYQGGRLVLDGGEPAGGVRAGLQSSDGRPAIAAEVDGKRQALVIDSGADRLVLFERGPDTPRHAVLMTNFSSVQARPGEVMLGIGDAFRRRMRAVRVRAKDPDAGLLPTAAFGSVYVSNRNGKVVLIP
ncbi:MAG TPA: retropepsin-like aspartic protease [Bryobacteraceae bacterium]|nr:retropepsin-like aspartic protease [Bryobacteraceae bacterium]